jgi:competence protein ComFC
MRCLLCENLSLSHICKKCQNLFLKPAIFKRYVGSTLVISFYRYDDIKELIYTKHTDIGFYIFNILAKNSFKHFAKEFDIDDNNIASIAIDDNAKYGYSHTAILNKHLKSKKITPLFNKLRASSNINYSGKSREFRFNNPKKFKLIKDFSQPRVILVDDILTTGSTMTQAIELLQRKDKDILFCLCLCDAGNK